MPSRQTVFETGESNIHRSRSIVDLSHKNTLTLSAGRLYPILAYSDVLPGDTHKLNCSFVCRSTTPINPVMDDAYLQVEFWWVPNLLVLSRASMAPAINDSIHSWKAFFGAQDNLLNVGLINTNAKLPVLPFDGTVTNAQTLYMASPLHYLDYPFIVSNISTFATALPDEDVPAFMNPFALLSFYQVWSDAYREPNLWNPVTYSISSVGTYDVVNFTVNYEAGIVDTNNVYKSVMPIVCREHGYFGSALPWPQRNATGVPVSLLGYAPLVVDDSMHPLTNSSLNPARFGFATESFPTGKYLPELVNSSSSSSSILDLTVRKVASSNNDPHAVPMLTNLVADLGKATDFTINQLRYSFALQAYYEALSRVGNRYDDIIRLYGVSRRVACADRSEYLGGKRIPLSQTQVPSTADANSPIGSLGAFSNTSDFDHYFTKSFNDFGTIVGVAFVRHHDTLTNRLSKERSRIHRMQYWTPQFANIGETQVYRNELFINFYNSLTSSGLSLDVTNGKVFGYQEYAAEYRYHEDVIHGVVNPDLGSINYKGWSYATDFSALINATSQGDIDALNLGCWLSAEYQVAEFDQTLQVPSSSAGFQFLVQFYFDWKAARPIPYHSIPAVLGAR